MSRSLRAEVAERAGGRCEYCRLPERLAPWAPFQLEHIRARQHGGATELGNLAWACPRCNAYKGPNLTAIDPADDRAAPLFDPRTQAWTDHFAWCDDGEIAGMSATGRATVALLRMNDPSRLALRRQLAAEGHEDELRG